MSPRVERLRVFVYGTLIIPEVMEAVTGRAFPSTSATLPGYARYAVRDECFPAIVPESEKITAGTLYLHVDEPTLVIIDRFEGDLYERRTVQVESEVGGKLEAETYVLAAKKADAIGPSPWDVTRFRRDDLEEFLQRCRRFRRELSTS